MSPSGHGQSETSSCWQRITANITHSAQSLTTSRKTHRSNPLQPQAVVDVIASSLLPHTVCHCQHLGSKAPPALLQVPMCCQCHSCIPFPCTAAFLIHGLRAGISTLQTLNAVLPSTGVCGSQVVQVWRTLQHSSRQHGACHIMLLPANTIAATCNSSSSSTVCSGTKPRTRHQPSIGTQ